MTWAEYQAKKENRTEPLWLVELGSPTCSLCKFIRPQLEKLVEDFGKDQVAFDAINAMENIDIARELKLEAIPAVYLYAGQEEVLHYIKKVDIPALKKAMQEKLS